MPCIHAEASFRGSRYRNHCLLCHLCPRICWCLVDFLLVFKHIIMSLQGREAFRAPGGA